LYIVATPQVRWLIVFVALYPLAAPSSSAQRRAGSGDVLVAAAASLSGLARPLTEKLQAAGLGVRFNFAASNTLARQIVEGARVDVFISADEAQMDVVQRAGRLVPGTRHDVLTNRLVVVVPAAAAVKALEPADLLAPWARRIAVGDPAAVPAGVYGRQWLERTGLWSKVLPKLVPLQSAPAVVAAVREGRADAGIVYATDALLNDQVRIAHHVNASAAPRIVYPAAAIAGNRVEQARAVLAWLRGSEAGAIFQAAGFGVVGER
jgi:molybdate transport system substrate-binding protein